MTTARIIAIAAAAACSIPAGFALLNVTRCAPLNDGAKAGGPAIRQALQVPPPIAAGSPMAPRLADINWRNNGRTLVLAISTDCHFCRESSQSYRRIAKKVGPSIRIVAPPPQSAHEAKRYLEGEGVQVDAVRRVSLEVTGTPTMLLVNAGGAVEKVWIGKLQHTKLDENVLGDLKRG